MTFVHAHLVWFIVAASMLAVGAGASTVALVTHRRRIPRRRRSRRR